MKCRNTGRKTGGREGGREDFGDMKQRAGDPGVGLVSKCVCVCRVLSLRGGEDGSVIRIVV